VEGVTNPQESSKIDGLVSKWASAGEKWTNEDNGDRRIELISGVYTSFNLASGGGVTFSQKWGYHFPSPPLLSPAGRRGGGKT